MSVAEVQTNLILKVLQTKDKAILEHLAEYLQNILEKKDWWDDLSPAQKSFVERSSRQIDEGKVVPHSVVRAQVNSILQKQ